MLVFLVKLLLPSVSATVITTFRCESYDGGAFVFLLADHSVSCRSNVYAFMLVGAPSFVAFAFDASTRVSRRHHPVTHPPPRRSTPV